MKGISADQKTIKINLKAKVLGKKDMSCDGCYFNDVGYNCEGSMCCETERKDGKNIIWVETNK